MPRDQGARRAPTSIVSFFAVFAALIVVLAGAGTWLVWRATQNAALNEATSDTRFAAAGAASAIDAAIRDAETLVSSTAQSPSVPRALGAPAGCTLSFAGVGPFTAGHLDFIGADGGSRCTSNPTAGTKYPMTTWFPALRSGGPAAVALEAEPSKQQVLVAAAAVPGGGYVAAFLDVDVLGQGLGNQYGGRRDLEFVVTTRNDQRILTRSVDDAAWRGKSVADTALAGVGAGGSHTDVTSVPRVYSRAATTQTMEWFVYAGADRAAAIADGTAGFRLLIIVVGTAVLGLLLLLAGMYHRIVAPIRALYRGTRAQRSSALVVPLPENGPREIGTVARELNAVMSELSESEQSYRVLFDGNPQPMWVWSIRTGCFLAVNQATIDLYGYTREQFLAMPVHQIVPSAYVAAGTDGESVDGPSHVVRSGPLVKSGPWTHVTSSGDTISVEVTSHDFTYLGEPGRFTIVVDISERLEHERQLQHLALHDDLTGLANRTLILDRLSTAISHAQSGIAVLFVDIDGFKLINEVHGHEAGDHLLTVVGQRLLEGLRPSDSIGRVGADEFVIVCPQLSGETEAIAMASRVEGLLALPIDLAGVQTFVTASVGISMSTRGSVPADLVRDAKLAMNRAKERGGDRFEIFDEGIRERTLIKLATINELRRAVDKDELRLQFQPEIDMSTGICSGFEALVRWEHPSRGLLAPAHFVELAEETGFIVQLGAWVLDAACRQAAMWVRQGLAVGTISVNLSARELAQPSLVGQVSSALDRSGLEPGRLCLEITETSLMDDPDGAVAVLAALRDLGVKLSIDDFGTGYSSLQYLRRYKVDYLKIDRSFVSGLCSDPQSTAIVSSVIRLAHALDLTVVAEGVESVEHAGILSAMDCDLGQGFLWSRPVWPADVPELCGRTLIPPRPLVATVV